MSFYLEMVIEIMAICVHRELWEYLTSGIVFRIVGSDGNLLKQSRENCQGIFRRCVWFGSPIPGKDVINDCVGIRCSREGGDLELCRGLV